MSRGGAAPTPLPYEMRSLGYPRCRTNGGHNAGERYFHYNDGMEYAARLLVFDLDGTLVDSKEDLANAVPHDPAPTTATDSFLSPLTAPSPSTAFKKYGNVSKERSRKALCPPFFLLRGYPGSA